MPPRPTLEQLVAHVDSLRSAQRSTASRLDAHLDRERRGGTINDDGYPAATMGGSGTSGNGGDIDSAVWSAVTVRLEGIQRDEHRTLTRQACKDLEQAVVCYQRCVSNLDKLDKLDVVVEKVAESEWCRHHARIYPDDARGRVAVSERRPSAELCERCAKFLDDEKELPPVNVLDRWALGKRHRDIDVNIGLGRTTGAKAFARKVWAFGSDAR